jgi:hypothetical protein
MTETTILPRSGKKSTSSKTVKNGKSQREKPVGPDDAPARSERILASMLAFRDGDFTVRLPTNWSGTDGRIAGAFNQALRNEDRIAQEMARLSVTWQEDRRGSTAQFRRAVRRRHLWRPWLSGCISGQGSF